MKCAEVIFGKDDISRIDREILVQRKGMFNICNVGMERSDCMNKGYPDLNEGRRPRCRTDTEIVETATDFHNQVAHTFLPQTNRVFHDTAALDTTDDVFDYNATLCNDLVIRFLFWR